MEDRIETKCFQVLETVILFLPSSSMLEEEKRRDVTNKANWCLISLTRGGRK